MKDQEQEQSTLDFLLDILSISRRPTSSDTGVKGDYSLKHNNGFDYNFSLLSTVILILLIGLAMLGGLVLVLALLT